MLRAKPGEALDACFAALERAACDGARCPLNGSNSVHKQYTTQLARDGYIKVEISGQNYRTVTILTGKNAGKHTAPDPTGQRVWRVIDANGSRHVGPRFDEHKITRTGGVVSAPRTLPSDWDYRV